MRFANNKMRDTTHARLDFPRCQCQQTIICVMNHLPIKPDVKGMVYPRSRAGTYPPEANIPSLHTSRLPSSPGFQVLLGNLLVCEAPLYLPGSRAFRKARFQAGAWKRKLNSSASKLRNKKKKSRLLLHFFVCTCQHFPLVHHAPERAFTRLWPRMFTSTTLAINEMKVPVQYRYAYTRMSLWLIQHPGSRVLIPVINVTVSPTWWCIGICRYLLPECLCRYDEGEKYTFFVLKHSLSRIFLYFLKIFQNILKSQENFIVILTWSLFLLC